MSRRPRSGSRPGRCSTCTSYLGILGRTAGGGGGPLKWAFLAVGLIATAVVAVLVGRKGRAMLAAKGVGGA